MDRFESIEEANQRIRELSRELSAATAERDIYRLVFDRAPLLIWYKDDKNNVIRANAPAAASAGLTPEEAVGRSTFDLYPEEADGYYQDDLEVLRSGQPKLGIIEQLDTPEGKRWVQTDKVPWRSAVEGTAGVLVFVTDITDRVRVLEELYRAQRLESIGILAGGIAHDFNNLLTSVYGNLELLGRELGLADSAEKGEGPADGYLRRAVGSIGRARSLTRQLLTFAKGGQPGRRPVLLVPLIEEVVALALSGSSIRPEVVIEAGLPPCLGDRDQIAQVLENLLVNAMQAIEEAETNRERVEAKATGVCRIEAHSSLDPLPTHGGRWIEITVSDSGAGIESDHLERIFDPFFTTKSEGSGLGLASAYSIAKRHGGTLDCRNRPEGGASFRLLLPVASRSEAREQDDGSSSELSLPPLRVLLVDDDEAIRRLGQSAGPLLGLEIQCVDGLSQALRQCERARESGLPYDVAIIDLTIRGGPGGEEVLAALRSAQPDLPAIVCSGYSDDHVMIEPERHGFQAALAKPYLLEDLKAALDSATSRGIPRVDLS